MPRKLTNTDVINLHKRYLSGESSNDIAKTVGVAGGSLRKRFQVLNLPLRSISEGNRVQAQRTTPEARSKRAQAAHDAVRGKKQPIEQLLERAIYNEAFPQEMSAAEQTLYERLLPFGEVVRQKAVGIYNLDFCINDSIGVECWGGQWHGYGRHAARHLERTRHILNAGYDIVIVWVCKKRIPVDSLIDAITSLQSTSRNPASLRQYRVIWSSGYVLSRNANSDDFPLKPSFIRLTDSLGRYKNIAYETTGMEGR